MCVCVCVWGGGGGGGGLSVLTDVVLSADFLQDVDLLHRRLPDLLDLLRGRLVQGGDVDDLHRVLLRRPLVDAATHHAAHPPEVKHIQLSISTALPVYLFPQSFQFGQLDSHVWPFHLPQGGYVLTPVCSFVCLSARLHKKYRTDYHKA